MAQSISIRPGDCGRSRGRRSPSGLDEPQVMTRFLLIHRHQPGECLQAHTAWRAIDATLPHTTPRRCADGGHTIWWRVRARSRHQALELLPERLRKGAHPVPIT
jgi:hypothetical protein